MFRKSVLTACITTGRVAVVIFALCCLAISVPRAEAQDQGPAVLPSFLFSTSDVVDESVVPRQDFHARLKKMRQRPEAVAVRIVSIANPAGAAQAGAVRIDLDGQTIVAKKEVQQRKGKGLDAKQFWITTARWRTWIGILPVMFWDMALAFNRTDTFTSPEHVGTRGTTLVEPASISSPAAAAQFFLDEVADHDAEHEALRDDYDADVIVLIIDPADVGPRGAARGFFPTNLEDAIFYVRRPYVDNTKRYTPTHELGHLFDASHGPGYYVRDNFGQSVDSACYSAGGPNQFKPRSNRTLMYSPSSGNNHRFNLFSSDGETVTHWCPDELPLWVNHVFNLGNSTHDVEEDYIEGNEDCISNLYETLNSSQQARAGTVAEAGSADPEALSDTDALRVESFPNPFNPQATLRFTLPEAGYVHMAIYDVLGREVVVLVDGAHQTGVYEARFDGASLPSGIYLYRLTVSGEHRRQEATGRLNLLK